MLDRSDRNSGPIRKGGAALRSRFGTSALIFTLILVGVAVFASWITTAIADTTSNGPLLTSFAILLSAIIAAVIAVISIGHQREIARKQATLSLLSEREWDETALKSREQFIRERDSEDGLVSWADPKHRDTPQATAIRHVLNEYELIAIGIKESILDEELYRRWFRGTCIRDWEKSARFVYELRQRPDAPDTLFTEFEELAVSWGAVRQPFIPADSPQHSAEEDTSAGIGS